MSFGPVDFFRFKLEPASTKHAHEICALINLAYRGDTGWTRETNIIQGDRTSHPEIKAAIINPNAHFFVVHQRHELISCVYVEKREFSAYIGFLSVHPNTQDKGIGKHILKQAEIFAQAELGVKKYAMFVVSQRPELIEFYERRGYTRTGKVEIFPLHLDMGTPKTNDLTIEYLEKKV